MGPRERGVWLAERARKWIVGNPGTWRAVVRLCRDLQADGYHLSRSRVYVALEDARVRLTDDDLVALRAHDLWSGLVRYMRRYYPDIRFPAPHGGQSCLVDLAYPDPSQLPALPREVVDGRAA